MPSQRQTLAIGAALFTCALVAYNVHTLAQTAPPASGSHEVEPPAGGRVRLPPKAVHALAAAGRAAADFNAARAKRAAAARDRHAPTAHMVAAAVAPTALANNSAPRLVVLRTKAGDVRIKLRDDWHRPSTDAVRALAGTPGACINRARPCELYRVEHGFLVQGHLRGSLPVNTKTGCVPAPACQPGPRVMVRGDVGWAGGGPGPDFFVYLGARPASWLKRDHTVWGEVADEQSLATADRIVGLPSHTPGGPNTMRFLKDKLAIDVVWDEPARHDPSRG